jgi:hypothetical protein
MIDSYTDFQVARIINSMVDEQELGKEFLITEEDIDYHKKDHVVPSKDIFTIGPKDLSYKTHDSTQMISETITEFDDICKEILTNLEYDIPASFSRNVNAVKGLFKMKHDLIKLHAQIADDISDQKEVDLNKVDSKTMLALFERMNKIKKGALENKDVS